MSGGADNSDEKAALWTQLKEMQEHEMEEIKQARGNLQEEKEKMRSITADPTDIVEINAGGETIHCHRSTL